jgi:hypothetical protein
MAVINGFSEVDFTSAFSIYYTLDFGDTWQKSDFHGLITDYVGAGDPVLKFDNTGVAYLVSLSAKIVNNDTTIHTLISYSNDKGVTWNSIITNSNETDKPWLTVNNIESLNYKGYKYIPTVESYSNTSKIKMSILNEENTIIHSNIDVFNNVGGIIHLPCVEVNTNGDIFVSAYRFNPKSIIIARSENNGTSFNTFHQITPIQLNDYYDIVTGISSRIQCSPYMAIDKSGGTYNNRIYFTYTNYESGSTGGTNTYLDTYLTWSDDNGDTWETPKVINATASQNTQQFYSNIYVNDNGDLLLAWYDGRNDTENKNIDYYVGISTNGGNTIREIKVSSASSDFSKIGLKNGNFGIGDYSQIVATNNIAIPFWADGRTNDGDINVYFAKINIGNPTDIYEISSISDNMNVKIYPNIIKDIINTEITLNKPSNLRWSIIDVNGRIIKYSKLKKYEKGISKIKIPALSLKQGMYFIRFELNKGFIKTIKIIKK